MRNAVFGRLSATCYHDQQADERVFRENHRLAFVLLRFSAVVKMGDHIHLYNSENEVSDESSYSRLSSGEQASTSLTLLEGLRSADAKAWERIVEIWGPLIYGRCRKQGFSPHESNDLTQNVFIRVYSGFAGFERDGEGRRFRFWISTILRNEIAEFCRKRSQQPVSAGGTDFQFILNSLSDVKDADEEWCQPAQVVAQFLEVIRRDFEPRTWEAFQLVTFKGYSNKEAGEKLKISTEAVRQGTFRIRQRLKSELAGMLD